MRIVLLFSLYLLSFSHSYGQQDRPQNLVIVTLDGMRWQEVFGGADSLLTFDTTATYSHGYVKDRFWSSNEEDRRKKLLPFFWSELVNKGLLIGNRKLNSFVNNANPHRFSYPGYNEIFTGYPDASVNSNDKIPNKNINVLEHLNSLPEFKGKVAAFGSWGLYSYILNDKRSGIYVNDGFKDADSNISEKMRLLSVLQHQAPDLFHGGERLDIFTFQMGMEYLKVKKPRVMYFAFGDTDEFAHAGQYDLYMDAARKTDDFIRELWNYIQSDSTYANKTTLLITTDHGRGAANNGNWKHHGSSIEGADEIWIAAIGPSIPVQGELKNSVPLLQGQLAATIAGLLGEKFRPTMQKTLPSIPMFSAVER